MFLPQIYEDFFIMYEKFGYDSVTIVFSWVLMFLVMQLLKISIDSLETKFSTRTNMNLSGD